MKIIRVLVYNTPYIYRYIDIQIYRHETLFKKDKYTTRKLIRSYSSSYNVSKLIITDK